MTEEEKVQKLREIEKLLNLYGGTLEIAPYVLQYLSSEELDSIIEGLLAQQSNVIEANHEWLQQFKKVENGKKE